MMLNLDVAAGVLTGWIALALFSLHVISSPRHRTWMTIPEYVRRGFLLTGAMFTWRSVNFFSVAGAAGVFLGHINAEGMMALVSRP
jgi:xanthine/uracil permease